MAKTSKAKEGESALAILKPLLDDAFNTTATEFQKKQIAETKGEYEKVLRLLIDDRGIVHNWLVKLLDDITPDSSEIVREARKKAKAAIVKKRDKERLDEAKRRKAEAEKEISKLEKGK